MSKYIFVTGGVVSSLGKGITAASLGRLLIERGLRVTIQKLDPYINVDPGTMNPLQHGEVFVTQDGCETEIYSSIISKERRGEFLGATIQVVPHVTGEIKNAMRSCSSPDIDVVIVEIGGTVGDIEGLAFLEAIRQFERELKSGNYLHIHCTLVPYLESAGEVKTKPTQHSVKELTSLGLSPDIIVCRTNKNIELSDHNKRKIAMFCNLDDPECVIHNPDCSSIYEVPLVLNNQGLDRIVCEKLGLPLGNPNLSNWKNMVDTILSDMPVVNIAIVGKYTEVPDSYLSVSEAIKHAALKNKDKAHIDIISSEDIEVMQVKDVLKGYDGIVVPGGFGSRGIEGKIMTAKYCRENKVPYLGLCLGMQIACIEFARNVVGLKDANSTEFDCDTQNPVIHIMNEQKFIQDKGATMRLGNYKCHLLDGTKVRQLYGMPDIVERHRHRFEFNNDYADTFVKAGLTISGINDDKNLVEIIELKDHPFFVACQFHPEFKSRPYKPHPLFVGFVNQAIGNIKKSRLN